MGMRVINGADLKGVLSCVRVVGCARWEGHGSSSSRVASAVTCSAQPQDKLTPAPPWP